MVAEPFATPTTAQPSPGMAVGEGHFYADGFRPGDLKYCYGVLALLLQLNPGWKLADGTVKLQDGSTPPDLRDRFIIGAGALFALGSLGGGNALASHTHDYTHESAHVVTQPVFAAPTGHSSPLAHTQNHSGMVDHGDHATHGFFAFEVLGTPGSGNWVPVHTSSANVTTALAHAAHTANHVTNNNRPTAHGDHTIDHNHDALSRTTDASLSNNSPTHLGGAVGAVAAGAGLQLPPFAALYLLIKVS